MTRTFPSVFICADTALSKMIWAAFNLSGLMSPALVRIFSEAFE
tara:strand:- start:340 stop:471 length:132 start_codon:yes stop_codon:yes gene_type:complete